MERLQIFFNALFACFVGVFTKGRRAILKTGSDNNLIFIELSCLC